ncbi:MAG: LamG domain-containing protein [Magnetococcus sp. WYHC-3]
MKKLLSFVLALAILSVFFDRQPAHAALPALANLPQSGSIVSRWYMDEASGTRADSVGVNTLTDNNTVGSAAGQFSVTAADFEAANDEYLSITDGSQTGLDIAGDLSFGAWFKPETVTAQYHFLFGKSLHTGNQRGYYSYIYEESGTIYITFYISANGTSGATKSVTIPALSTGTWYHVAVVYDASAGEVDFYIDGAQVGVTQTGLATSIYNNTSMFAIGSYQALDYMDGMMQDAVLWTTELTSTEIDTLYDAYFPAPAPTFKPYVIIE